jgi:hypothetical protein
MASKDSESEGIKMRDECIALYADDKLLQAARLEKELEKKFPKIHSESAETLKPIRVAGDEAQLFHDEFNSTEGWTCVRQGSSPEDVNVWIRHEPGNALHTFRVEGEVDAPAEFLLVLMNEITLFDEWLPFIGGSRELAIPSRCERYAWVKFWSPAPAVVHHRDFCMYGRAIDGLDEDGCVLVLMKSFEGTAECGAVEPPPEARTTRIAMKFGAIELFPIAKGRTRIRAIALLDPKIRVLPAWLLNWVSTKVCYMGLRRWEHRAQQLRDGAEDVPHKARMREKSDYYSWVIARVRSRTDALPSLPPDAGNPAAPALDDDAPVAVPAGEAAEEEEAPKASNPAPSSIVSGP